MSGFLGNLIGSSGTTTATGQVQLPDWVNQAALTNYQTAMGLSQQPYAAYPGQMIAPFTPDQTAAFGATAGQLNAAAPTYAQALGNVQNLGQTTQSLLNPYLGNVEADTVSNIQRAAAQQGQQIAAQAQQGGAYGGTRYGVQQATLDSETQRNIGQAVNQIQSQGWNTASNLALQQAQTEGGLATNAQNTALQAAGALAQTGGAQQQQQQAQLAAQLAQWQQQQNWPYQQLSVAQGALAGSPYGTTSTSSQPYTTNTLAGALSTAATAIPAIGNLGSSIYNMFGSGSSPSFDPFEGNTMAGYDNPNVDPFAGNTMATNAASTASTAASGGGLFSGIGNLISDTASTIGSGVSGVANWLGL